MNMNFKIQKIMDEYKAKTAWLAECCANKDSSFNSDAFKYALDGLYANAIAQLMRCGFDAASRGETNSVYEALLNFHPPYDDQNMKDLNTTAVSAILQLVLQKH